MNVFFDTNKRFKAEPEEIFIEEDDCVEEAPEAPMNPDRFEYECSPSASALAPQYRDVPAILDGQFFEIVTVNETTCTALCKLCEPRRKTINGSLKATGNFYDHIKRMHVSYMAEAETKRGAKRKPRSKKFDPAHLMIDHDSLPTFFPYQESCTQEQAFNAIFGFVWETMQPTSIVDTESFRSMVEVLTKNNTIRIICPTSQQIQSAFRNSIHAITSLTEVCLKDIEYVCATADLWTQNDRAYVAVTGHAINPSNLQRESFALGFRQVKIDCRTDIAKEITDVLSKYKIQKKVQEIVTENVFLSTGDDFYELPGLEVGSIFRSFSRLLNLVVTSDVAPQGVRQNSPNGFPGERGQKYLRVYESCMKKLTAFWNCLKSSPRASSFCQQSCGKILPVPTDDWSSRFESIKVICETENLHKIFDQLQLGVLDTDDLNFLTEYVRILQPFATAFDILKDTGSFRGVVLPTILSIKLRLKAMSGLSFGEHMRILALGGLNKRFQMLDILSDKGFPFLIATISHPAFKLSCVPAELQNNAREVFLEACSTLSDKYTPKTAENTRTDSFFSVLRSPKASTDCITNEALRYLTDDSEDLAMLHRYPCVKNIFLKYNTCLSSSAPVEQLLAPCHQVFGDSRPLGFNDGLFEDYLLVKISNNKRAKL